MSTEDSLEYTAEELRVVAEAMQNLVSIQTPATDNIVHACQNIDALKSLLRQKSIFDVLQLALVDSKAHDLVVHALTIHTTSWFREPLILDAAVKQLKASIKNGDEISVLSMACSTGHEVYSIALLLKEAFPNHPIKIKGIDIDPVSINFAKDAVFKQSEIWQIPLKYHNNLLMGSGPTKDLFTLDEEILSFCSFEVKNICHPLDFDCKYDLIFCRNVFIYFTTNEIEFIKTSVHRRLKESGLLCLGVSESLGSNTSLFTLFKPGIYRVSKTQEILNVPQVNSQQKDGGRSFAKNIIFLNFSQTSAEKLQEKYDRDLTVIDCDGKLSQSQLQIFLRTKTVVCFGVPNLHGHLLKSLLEVSFFHLLVVVDPSETNAQLPVDQKKLNLEMEFFSSSDWTKVKSRAVQILDKHSRVKFLKKEPVKVLVAEDEHDVAELYAEFFSDSGFAVKVCYDGFKALEQLEIDRFDFLVSDFNMPGMNGGTLIRAALLKQPHLKCALVSGYLDEGKDIGLGPNIIRMAKPVIMSALVNSVLRSLGALVPPYSPQIFTLSRPALIVIGASTGGPQALQHIFHGLSVSNIPIVIVQHISENFHEAFYHNLVRDSGLELQFVDDSTTLQPNKVYVAVKNKHIEVREEFGKIIAYSRVGAPEHGMCPAVDPLFSSVAASVKQTTIGILMTGMGRDGAAGLKKMKAAGHITVVQDEKTSSVYGMPKAATEVHAALMEATLDEIRQIIHVDSQSLGDASKISRLA
jgi:chemotaxis methyl-accepting protein methylase/CheY-like chemotaxis protein